MNSSNNLGATILKASFLAKVIFWSLVLSEEAIEQYPLLIILSIIPISIVCSLTILLTIMPFRWSVKDNVSNKEIFKKYFPYYSIIAFMVSSYFIIISEFNIYVCFFFITAFFTLIQSWNWLFKTPINEKENS